jgi:hypothetical protein
VLAKDVGVGVGVVVANDVSVGVGVVGESVTVTVSVGVDVPVAVGVVVGTITMYDATTASQLGVPPEPNVPCAANWPDPLTPQVIAKSPGAFESDVLTGGRDDHIVVPVAAQFTELPFEPTVKSALDALALSSTIAPITSSGGAVIVAVLPLDGVVLAPTAPATLSSGMTAKPVAARASARWANGPALPVQVTVMVEPPGRSAARLGDEQIDVIAAASLTDSSTE